VFDVNNPWFDVDAFAAPALGSTGNTPRTVIQRPPISNLNASLFKNFPLGGHRRLQFRLEAYNVVNHTQISDIGRTLIFDSNPTSPTFGQLTNRSAVGIATNASRPPRVLQASFRLNF